MAMATSTSAVSATEQAELIELTKRKAAYLAVEQHLLSTMRHIGIGSGSTVVYVVEAIAAKGKEITDGILFYPTGDQSKELIIDAGLRLGAVSELPFAESLDVCFDGADEVDEELNLIKGGGACLFQEKIVATAAKKFVCVADYRKLSPRLGTNWKQGIPIEVLPLAAKRVLRTLELLGSTNPTIRQGMPKKAGPVVTDNMMWLIDAPFLPLLLPSDCASDGDSASGKGKKGEGLDGIWRADLLAERIIKIPGVCEVGLFTGFDGYDVQAGYGGAQKPVAAYFGMADGEVVVRKSKASAQ